MKVKIITGWWNDSEENDWVGPYDPNRERRPLLQDAVQGFLDQEVKNIHRVLQDIVLLSDKVRQITLTFFYEEKKK